MGLTVREWEDMTPAQLADYAKGYRARQEAQQRRTNVDLYNLAALISSVTLSRHPKSFEDVFPDQKQPQKEMTDEQMYAQVKMLNALFGGEEVS